MERPELGRPEASGRLLDLATRRYIIKVAVRWSPLMACTTALVLVVALTSPPPQGAGSAATSARPGSGLSATQSASGIAAAGPTSGSGAANGGGQTGLAGGGTGSSSTGAGTGTTVTGGSCKPGVKQFAWSVYAPPCVAAFHGNNGGSTNPGVTASTITLTYRLAKSTETAAINAIGGGAVPSDQAFVQDLQTYIGFFNTQYGLYGRRVVLKTFQGQGDYLAEDSGQGLQGAQADAATAKSMGAFGDITLLLTSSQAYEQDLAAEHVLSFSAAGWTQSWFEQYAPYQWSIWATGTKIAQSYANTVCGRMASMPAIFAGDPALTSQPRRFGFLTPDNPQNVAVGREITAGLTRCGVTLAKSETYSVNPAQGAQQGTAALAAFRADGVTTVLCMCDPAMPIFFANAANEQNYHPEWVVPNFLDPAGQQVSSEQWSHAISIDGWPMPPGPQTEAHRVFGLAAPGKQPAEQYYTAAYHTLLQVFEGLQAAGPGLTPTSFAQGMFSLPTSGLGQLGTWTHGNGDYTPPSNTQLEWWNPAAVSNFNGKKGAWVPCGHGQWVTYANPLSWAPLHQQLACFGR